MQSVDSPVAAFYMDSEPTSRGLSSGVRPVFMVSKPTFKGGVFDMHQSFFFSVLSVCLSRLTDNQTIIKQFQHC